MHYRARRIPIVDAAEGVDGQGGIPRDQPEAERAYGLAGARAAAGKDRRDKHGVEAQCVGARDAGARMGGCGLDETRAALAHAAQTGFGPMRAIRTDPSGKRWVGRDEQDEAALAADAREPCACGEPIPRAEMAIDHAPAPRQARGDCSGIRRARRIGHEPRSGKGPPVPGMSRFRKPRGRN